MPITGAHYRSFFRGAAPAAARFAKPLREEGLDAAPRALYNPQTLEEKEHRAHKTRRREEAAAEEEKNEGFINLQGVHPRQMLHVFFDRDRRAEEREGLR